MMMMRFMVGAVAVVLLPFATLAAQQGQEDVEKDKKKENLPPIILPEFDITGKEQPEPPDFSKGEFPEDLKFYPMTRGSNLEERESAALNQGRKPELPTGKTPGSLTGKVAAGYGKFGTPSFESWIGRTDKKMDVNISGRYSSSDGHVAFSNYRRAALDASVSWNLDSDAPILQDARVSTSGGYEGERYEFYGSPMPSAARSVHHGSVGVGAMSSFQPWDLTYEIRARWHAYSVNDVARSTENEVSVGLVGSKKTFGPVFARVNADLAANFLNSPLSHDNPIFVSVGMEGQARLFPGFQLKGGLAFYALKNSDTGARVRLYPQLEARYSAGGRVTIFAKSTPRAQKNSLRRLIEKNPYVANTVAIRHQEIVADFSGGVELALSAHARGRVVVSYQRSQNYPVSVDRERNGMWELSYLGRIRMFALGADATVQLSKNDELLGSIQLLNTQYSVTNVRVPYSPSALVAGTYQRSIGSRLNVQGSIHYVSQRYADLRATRRLQSYVRADARGEYDISGSIGFYVLIQNLFDQNYAVWEGYVARPFYVQTGLTVKW
ncbi:MAG: hypothetical protein ACE5H0_03700 [Bacteroidota bacterium]